MARRIHIVPVEDESNGVWRVANMLAAEDGGTVQLGCGGLDDAEEVWVHGMWLPREWRACWRALRLGKRLVRMTHGSLSPIYLRYHGWKKWLVGPIERFFLRRADRIVATCEAEKGWIEEYLGKRCPPIEVTDIKRFFDLSHKEHKEHKGEGKDSSVAAVAKASAFAKATADKLAAEDRVERVEGEGEDSRVAAVAKASAFAKATADKLAAEERGDGKLHLLYLGRRHPLKGLEFLEEAVKEVEGCELRIVSNAFGDEKEKVWEWCDVLVLPTLSENFGLVVAEALERGKRVITTDGAPAWSPSASAAEDKGDGNDYGGRLLYLVGYRDGSRTARVRLLKETIESLVDSGC